MSFAIKHKIEDVQRVKPVGYPVFLNVQTGRRIAHDSTDLILSRRLDAVRIKLRQPNCHEHRTAIPIRVLHQRQRQTVHREPGIWMRNCQHAFNFALPLLRSKTERSAEMQLAPLKSAIVRVERGEQLVALIHHVVALHVLFDLHRVFVVPLRPFERHGLSPFEVGLFVEERFNLGKAFVHVIDVLLCGLESLFHSQHRMPIVAEKLLREMHFGPVGLAVAG